MKRTFTIYEAALLIRLRFFAKALKEANSYSQAKSEEEKRLHLSREKEFYAAANRVTELYNDDELEFSEEEIKEVFAIMNR